VAPSSSNFEATSQLSALGDLARMSSNITNQFTVKFGKIARTLECDDADGRILFTFDLGSKGGKSLCLEHHPLDRPRSTRYDLAFQQAKQYLEACGYEVEIYGE
jgi:hypothetical protein